MSSNLARLWPVCGLVILCIVPASLLLPRNILQKDAILGSQIRQASNFPGVTACPEATLLSASCHQVWPWWRRRWRKVMLTEGAKGFTLTLYYVNDPLPGNACNILPYSNPSTTSGPSISLHAHFFVGSTEFQAGDGFPNQNLLPQIQANKDTKKISPGCAHQGIPCVALDSSLYPYTSSKNCGFSKPPNFLGGKCQLSTVRLQQHEFNRIHQEISCT